MSTSNVASIAGFGWRMNLERAKTAVPVKGFPDPATFASDHGVTDDIANPTSKEFLLLWTYQAAQDSVFKDRNIRVNADESR